MVLECEPLNLVWATRRVERVGLAPVPCSNQDYLVDDYVTKRLAILQVTCLDPFTASRARFGGKRLVTK